MRLFIGLSIFLVATSCTPRPQPPTALTGNVIASVGSTNITDLEFMERVGQLEKEFPRKFDTHPQKYELLKEMMSVELLYEAAIQAGLDKSFEFKTRLADLYVKKMSEDARHQLSREDIEKYFEDNKSDIEQISAKHILLKTNAKMSRSEKNSIRDKMESIRKEALAKPESFGELAKKHSQDGSAPNGGELGFFSRKMMVKPFSEAAFQLKKVGEISPVIESSFGFHIIQLSGDRRGSQYYEAQIRDQLLRSTQRTRLDAELEKLKRGKRFEIFDQNLQRLSKLPAVVSEDPEKILNFSEPDPIEKK